VRTYGTGTIEPLSRGRFRGRLPGRAGKRLPIRATREEAEADLVVSVRNDLAPAAPGLTLAALGRRVLQRRELDGYANARAELSRWATHVERTPFGRRAVRALERADVVEWMRGRLAAPVLAGHRARLLRPRALSRAVVVDALRILRSVVRAALDERLLSADPTAGVRVPRARGRTHEPWTYLRPAEVEQLVAVAGRATVKRDRGGVAKASNRSEQAITGTSGKHPRPGEGLLSGRRSAHVRLVHPEDADAAIVALYTGLREGELWTLHLRDVDLEAGRIVVRYGGRRGAKLTPTKGRKPRTLQLLSPALEALRRQVARLAEVVTPTATDLTRCRSCRLSRRAHDERRAGVCAVFAPPGEPKARANPADLVFPSLSRGLPTYRAERRPPKCWRAWLAAAKLDAGREDPAPVVWHSLRHTFATLALAGKLPGIEGEGWRIERVSAYLGHTSIAVTQRYADVAALL